MLVIPNVTADRFKREARTLLRTLLLLLLMPTAVAVAQNPPSPAAVVPDQNPLTGHSKFLYGGLQKMLLASAEIMPEGNYSFKPTDEVRSFGQIVGHVADAQYIFCSAVLGEKNPAPGVEKTKTSKADLIAALKEAFAYCNKAHDSVTDASAAQTVKMMGGDWPKLSTLTVNQVHGALHYGNIVTYLRMKDIVPPSSDPEFMKQLRK